MMPFTKQHSAYAWVVTCILFLINLTFHNLPLHSSYKIHQPITDYFLRLPYSELFEKRFFRSRANRRLVFTKDSRNLRFLYDFGGASLSQKPFHHQNLIWSQNHFKKIVHATKVPRICFVAKNSRNSRLFYVFFTVFVGNRTKIVKKRLKKSQMQPRSPESAF